MNIAPYAEHPSPIQQLDVRGRLVTVGVFAVVVALSHRFAALAAALIAAGVVTHLAKLPLASLLKRLVHMNLFMLLLFVLVPVTSEGTTAFTVLSLAYTWEGLAFAAALTLKANAIVLVSTALLGTTPLWSLGYALHCFHVPRKLILLFILTLRYIEVLQREYDAMHRAMHMRGFRPGMNLHTYRSYGHMAGMLLVRSLDRSERVIATMKSRGFDGSFRPFHQSVFTRRDAVFAATSTAAIVALVCMEFWPAAWRGMAL